MSFKKIINSSNDNISIIKNSNYDNKYPVGFEYMVGGTIYRVSEIINKDANSPMRLVITSEGTKEVMSVETIDKDLKESDAKILGEEPKEEIPEEPKGESKGENNEIQN